MNEHVITVMTTVYDSNAWLNVRQHTDELKKMNFTSNKFFIPFFLGQKYPQNIPCFL